MNKKKFEQSNEPGEFRLNYAGNSMQIEKRKRLKLDLITCNFIAIIILFTFTPLGFIHLGIVKLTLLHIPVIMASLILGKKRGALVGFFFGLLSLIINTMSPGLMSFAFSPVIPVYGSSHGSLLALVICFIPRIILGYMPGAVVDFIENRINQNDAAGTLTFDSYYDKKKRLFIYSGLAFFSTLLHTMMVVILLIVFFLPAISSLRSIDRNEGVIAILVLCLNNGIPEAFLAMIAVPGLAVPLKSFTNKVLARK